MSVLPDLYDAWGPLARAQGLIVAPMGTLTDDGAGQVVIGAPGLRIISPLSGARTDVAAGTYNLPADGALAVKIPPTSFNNGVITPAVIPWVNVQRDYDHRDYIALGYRVGSGKVAWAFPALQQAALVQSVTTLYDVQGAGSSWDTFNQFGATGIPQNHKHLEIEFSGRCTSASAENLWLRINGDATQTNYYSEEYFVSGGSLSATDFPGTATGLHAGQVPRQGGLVGQSRIFIPNYAASLFHRGVHAVWMASDNNTPGGTRVGQSGGARTIVEPITRLALFPGSGTFIDGTRITLRALD